VEEVEAVEALPSAVCSACAGAVLASAAGAVLVDLGFAAGASARLVATDCGAAPFSGDALASVPRVVGAAALEVALDVAPDDDGVAALRLRSAGRRYVVWNCRAESRRTPRSRPTAFSRRTSLSICGFFASSRWTIVATRSLRGGIAVLLGCV
jgi:hypothetical protein